MNNHFGLLLFAGGIELLHRHRSISPASTPDISRQKEKVERQTLEFDVE